MKFNEQFLYDDSQPDLANVLRVRADQMLEVINVRQIQNLQDELESSSDESDETLDEIRVDTEERRLVESGGNQEEPDIESSERPDSHLSKDDSTPGLPTPDKTPEPNSPEPPLSSNTSAKKKPHYVMVPTDEAEPKKKIGGDVGEQNVVKGKRLKGRSKAYAGFLADVTRESLPTQRSVFNVGLTFHKKLHRDQLLPVPGRRWELIAMQLLVKCEPYIED